MIVDNLAEKCFIEQQEYSYEKYGDLFKELFIRGYCVKSKNGNFTFKVTGFLSVANEVFIVFPKGYRNMKNFDLTTIKSHIGSLLAVLMRYRSEGKLEPEEQELLGSPEQNCVEGIAAAFWLIRDYQEFGFIRREMRTYRVNCGNNIDWPRTIKTKNPYFSNGRPVYTNLITRKTDSDFASILYHLHRYVVSKSYKKYGWLICSDEELDNPNFREIPCEIEVALHILRKELASTFVDREIRLIHIMIEFISGSGENVHRAVIETLATQYFHCTWEAICKHLFHDEYEDLRSSIPQPVWHVQEKKNKVIQIPDILFVEKDKLYILDAKYYDTKRNLPGWHDLVKQFFYKYSLIENVYKKTENVLIFPANTKKSVIYFGYVDFEKFVKLGRIDAVCIDTYEAMNCYGRYVSGEFRTVLIEIMKNKI